jgi:hypothetical protein
VLARAQWKSVSSRLSVASTSMSTSAVAGVRAAVAGLVGIEGGVVSGVFNLESSGVDALDWRPRHDQCYHEA